MYAKDFCEVLYVYFYLILTCRHEVNSVVQRRNLQFEEIRQLTQGHICRKWQRLGTTRSPDSKALGMNPEGIEQWEESSRRTQLWWRGQGQGC